MAYAVGLYITAGYWFTSSTSFANPAVTIARAFTDTFAGIRPLDAPGFIGAQLIAAVVVTVLFSWLLKPANERETSLQAEAWSGIANGCESIIMFVNII